MRTPNMSDEKTRDEIRQKVGERIKESRDMMSLNAKEFAKKLDTSYQQVYRWENGKTVPSLYTIIQIAELANVSADWLLDITLVAEFAEVGE